jgi:CTP:molybdopterin cytidylyltransferase MocA
MPIAPENTAGVVMAAGAGSRFGFKPKGLLERDGQPLAARQIGLLARAGLRRIVVVLGRHALAFEPVLQRARAGLPAQVQLDWVVNPTPEDGAGASLRCALARLAPETAAVLVALADQPLLQDEDIDAVLRGWRARAPGIELVVPTYGGQPGHPLVFGRAPMRWLARQPAAAGLRDWRRAHPAQVQALPVTHPRHTLDIDTEADLAALAASHGVHLRWPADDQAAA